MTPDEIINQLNKKSREIYEHKIKIQAYKEAFEKIKENADLEIYCDNRNPSDPIRTYHIQENMLDKMLDELIGE